MRSDGNKLKKRQDIQVLRGIAVSGVFLFHLLPDHFPSGSLSSLFESNSNVPRSLMLPASFADSTLLRKGLDQTRISLFDSSQLLCSERMCSFKRNGKYLYWESNHLSRDGAEQYSEFFSSLGLDR